MSLEYAKVKDAPRLLIEAQLKPLQGSRFQPTGFPDLGPARYTAPDGVEMLLVESAQSVANRMEMACWDEAKHELIAELKGLPYIQIYDKQGNMVSNSVLEAHRINSEYIMKNCKMAKRENGKLTKTDEEFNSKFADEIDYKKDGMVSWDKFRKALLKYDINSLIHGCFLEEIGGRLRIARLLSGFIEASNVNVVESGGVKNNIVQPELKGGEGNVPFPRTEFSAEKITAYFNVDLALLRSYGLDEEAEQLFIALSLFKIRRFLSTGLRLRTACDLDAKATLVTKPADFTLPEESELLAECKSLIEKCSKKELFANPPVTEVLWKK